jgi:hypothetical protein
VTAVRENTASTMKITIEKNPNRKLSTQALRKHGTLIGGGDNLSGHRYEPWNHLTIARVRFAPRRREERFLDGNERCGPSAR